MIKSLNHDMGVIRIMNYSENEINFCCINPLRLWSLPVMAASRTPPVEGFSSSVQRVYL